MSSSSSTAAQPKVWVKLIADHNDPFKVNFTQGMDIHDLKKSIRAESVDQCLPLRAIGSIYSANDNNEEHKMKAYDIVPPPTEGQIGSSGALPYFFSLYSHHTVVAAAAEEAGAKAGHDIVSSSLFNFV